MINVTIFNEFIHENEYDGIRKIYPNGIHNCIKNFLCESDQNLNIKTATFGEKDHGLSTEILDTTDVLIFWSHARQNEFSDKVAQDIHQHILSGMGFIGLHSAHFSKPMKLTLGTSMTLKWKHGEKERLFCTAPLHPIAQGIPEIIEIPDEEMYGEYFDIPRPNDVVFTGWFSNGYVFRSGVTFTRGKGKIFYFQPGHEEYPVYYQKEIQQIIKNAVYWAYNPQKNNKSLECQEIK